MVKTDIIVIGAGPVGLFTVFEAGLLGLNCTLIDNLDKPGGQCAELYPEKPIYDIPGVPFQTAQEHVDALLEQIKPFDYELHLSERVDSIEEIKHEDDNFWKVKTTEEKEFFSKNIFIAAGAGSFEPRRPPNIEDPDKFLTNGVEYAVRSVDKYKDKNLYESLSAYGLANHRHNSEIQQELDLKTGKKNKFHFTPHLTPMFRGILSTIYVDLKKGININEIINVLNVQYKNHKFIKICKINTFLSTNDVINTNNCFISVCKSKYKDKIIILSAIDNLIKGGGGQAVQNMNNYYGFNQSEGLNV